MPVTSSKKYAAPGSSAVTEYPLWQYDQKIQKDYPILAGVDEAGRGPLAGDVVAACVILDISQPFPGINDSKKLKERLREKLFDEIIQKALYYGIGKCSPAEIDELNILQATFLAMRRAVNASNCQPDLILVDGNQKIPQIPFQQQSLIQGDGLSASIAAASILAKVTRDRIMKDLHAQFPDYGFLTNKGYATRDHLNALRHKGLTPFHRRSFKPSSLLQLNIFDC